MENSSCWDRLTELSDDVIKNYDGTLRRPISLNYILFITHCICCALGFPANIQLIIKILCNANNDPLKPRHLFLLAISFSSIFILMESAVEMAYYITSMSKENECDHINCHIYEAISGLPYVVFLLNLLASLIECCVVLTGPGQYNNLSSNIVNQHYHYSVLWKIIVWLTLLNLALALSVKWVFVSGLAWPIQLCLIRKTHVITIYWTSFVLFVSCIIIYTIDLFIVMLPKEFKRRYRWTVPRQQNNSASYQHRFTEDETFLQLKCIRSFLFSVSPVLLLFLPWLTSAVVCYLDIPWFLAFKGDCETNICIISYFRELITVMNGVVYPLINLCKKN